ncbi:unnamed protein product [Cuscuta campestris]|uniref:Uncharacterized protein n=1 Tax=Cuscuta campestris TaxID=132261 RepID=A0A484N4D6_9ASTE|nr:unnamed protein product [Cuscuta campestris]
MGAAAAPVGMRNGGELAGIVVLVVSNLAVCAEGKAALLDAQAVETVVGWLRHDNELDDATQENSLYSMTQGCLKFKGMA